jgi:hypothetical protein
MRVRQCLDEITGAILQVEVHCTRDVVIDPLAGCDAGHRFVINLHEAIAQQAVPPTRISANMEFSQI